MRAGPNEVFDQFFLAALHFFLAALHFFHATTYVIGWQFFIVRIDYSFILI